MKGLKGLARIRTRATHPHPLRWAPGQGPLLPGSVSPAVLGGKRAYGTSSDQAGSRPRAGLDPYNALTCLFSDSHAESSKTGPLSHLRVSIKENLATAEGYTSCASDALARYNSPYDATVVSLLRASGAQLVGKTNMDEFGMGSHGVHSAHGPVLNPLNTAHVAGGSSSGAAASVAAGLCDVAIGSDTGGSIRLPASYTGTIGFKPSYGLLSRHGLVAYASSLDTVGMLAKTVENVRSVFHATNSYDEKDPTAIPAAFRQPRSARGIQGRRTRVGVPVEAFASELSQASISSLREALGLMRTRLDIEILSVSIPSTSRALSAYYTIASAEASSNLARYDGVRYGYRGEGSYADTRSRALGAEVQKRLLLGTYALTADAFDNYFLAAQRLRQELKSDMDAVFRHHNPLRQAQTGSNDGVDILAFPSAISVAPTIQAARSATDGTDSYVQDVLTAPASLAGLPALSYPVPVPLADGNLPVGVQLVGQWGDDDLVLDIAQALED